MSEARKAAEERYPDGRSQYLPGEWEVVSNARDRDAFIEGAEWQAARTPQITAEMGVLLATAKEMREQLGEDYPKRGSILDLWLRTAAALEAALGQTNDTKGGE